VRCKPSVRKESRKISLLRRLGLAFGPCVLLM
jgi:hypothetical protein